MNPPYAFFLDVQSHIVCGMVCDHILCVNVGVTCEDEGVHMYTYMCMKVGGAVHFLEGEKVRMGFELWR